MIINVLLSLAWRKITAKNNIIQGLFESVGLGVQRTLMLLCRLPKPKLYKHRDLRPKKNGFVSCLRPLTCILDVHRMN